MDDSALTDIEKERIMNKRTGKRTGRLLKIDVSIDDEDEHDDNMLDMSSIIETESRQKSTDGVVEDSKKSKKKNKSQKKKTKKNV